MDYGTPKYVAFDAKDDEASDEEKRSSNPRKPFYNARSASVSDGDIIVRVVC